MFQHHQLVETSQDLEGLQDSQLAVVQAERPQSLQLQQRLETGVVEAGPGDVQLLEERQPL